MNIYAFETEDNKLHLYGYGSGADAALYLEWINTEPRSATYKMTRVSELKDLVTVDLRELLIDLGLI